MFPLPQRILVNRLAFDVTFVDEELCGRIRDEFRREERLINGMRETRIVSVGKERDF